MLGQALRRRKPVGVEFDVGKAFDTAGNVPVWSMDIASPDAYLGEPYQPTVAEDLRDSLSSLDIDFARHDFIDLGCGKGKPLLIAHEFGFRRLVGVEFARDLVEVAKRNMTAGGIDNATILTQDAGQFEFPSEPFVLFLFNPFSGEVMARVLASLAKCPHSDYVVVYNNPKQSETFAKAGHLELERTIAHSPPTQIWRPRRKPV